MKADAETSWNETEGQYRRSLLQLVRGRLFNDPPEVSWDKRNQFHLLRGFASMAPVLKRGGADKPESEV